MLSEAEKRRYKRQITLPEIGESGQEKLKAAKVFVIGAGGLGTTVLQYLTIAGVGNITIMDDAVVNESNLHQQCLYGSNDMGKLKTIISGEKLKSLNPLVRHEIFNIKLKRENALDFISRYDVIVDATNDFSSQYLINDACIIAGKPWVFATTAKFGGHISTFNFNGGPSLRCAFPEDSLREIQKSSENGCIGLLSGIIGCLQAVEVINLITGIGKLLTGKVLFYNMLEQTASTALFNKNPENFKIIELNRTY